MFGLHICSFSTWVLDQFAWRLLFRVAITAAHFLTINGCDNSPMVVTHHFTSTKAAFCLDACARPFRVLDTKSFPFLHLHMSPHPCAVHNVISRSTGYPPFKKSLDVRFTIPCLLFNPFLETRMWWLTPKELCCEKNVLLVMNTSIDNFEFLIVFHENNVRCGKKILTAKKILQIALIANVWKIFASLTDSRPRPFPSLFISSFCFTQLQLALITCHPATNLISYTCAHSPFLSLRHKEPECCCLCSSCVRYLNNVSVLVITSMDWAWFS